MQIRRASANLRRRPKADRLLLAARIRAARAVLIWSQSELGKKARVTQRAIYRIETAGVKARRLTQVRINKVLKDAGIEFEELPNGGFEMIVPGRVLARLARKGAVQI